MQRRALLLTLLLPALLLACVDERGSGGGGNDGNNDDNNSFNNSSPAQKTDRGDLKVRWEDGQSEDQQAFATWLQDSEFFEEIAQGFNSGLAFPHDITIIHGACGVENAFYVPAQKTIIMCYEMVQFIYNAFANSGIELTDQQLAQATFDTWIFIFFHELGHALVDAYDLPITGREEDAVDDFSTVLLIEGGLHGAVFDAAIFWYLIDQNMVASPTALADEHSLNLQRLYNLLCLIAGDDPSWEDLILSNFDDLMDRMPLCAGEYAQKSSAWMRLLEPWEK